MQNDAEMIAILKLEHQRREALVQLNKKRLEEIFHPSLVHVHSHGGVDSYQSFLDGGGFKVDYRRIERFHDLRVQVFRDTALMTGSQLMEIVRKATGELVEVESFVTQMWVLVDGCWRQVSFQATSIPKVPSSTEN